MLFFSSLHCPETIPTLVPIAEWIIFTEPSSCGPAASDTRSDITRRQTRWEKLSLTVLRTLHMKFKLVQFYLTACQLYAIEHSSVWQLLKILQGSIQLEAVRCGFHHWWSLCITAGCRDVVKRELESVLLSAEECTGTYSSLILPVSYHQQYTDTSFYILALRQISWTLPVHVPDHCSHLFLVISFSIAVYFDSWVFFVVKC